VRKIKNGLIPCPECQSRQVTKMGSRIIQGIGRVQRFQCQKCGKTFSEQYVTMISG